MNATCQKDFWAQTVPLGWHVWMMGGLLGALPLQQTHSDAKQPLLTRVFCTKDKAQVAFEPIFHQWQGLCQVWGGCMSCWESTPTPLTSR